MWERIFFLAFSEGRPSASNGSAATDSLRLCFLCLQKKRLCYTPWFYPLNLHHGPTITLRSPIVTHTNHEKWILCLYIWSFCSPTPAWIVFPRTQLTSLATLPSVCLDDSAAANCRCCAGVGPGCPDRLHKTARRRVEAWIGLWSSHVQPENLLLEMLEQGCGKTECRSAWFTWGHPK